MKVSQAFLVGKDWNLEQANNELENELMCLQSSYNESVDLQNETIKFNHNDLQNIMNQLSSPIKKSVIFEY